MMQHSDENGAGRGRGGRSGGRIRVVIVDDHPAIRDAMAETIKGKMDIDLCGEAASAAEALQLLDQVKPDVAVVDLSLEDAHGLDLVQNIRVQHPEVQVVVFSMYDENVYAERAIRAGASGYVMKSESTQNVAEAIRSVWRGEVYLSRRMSARILSKLAKGESSRPSFAVDEFTDREMAVFQMLGEGYTVEDIAERLHLTRKTVETYRRRAKEKLGYRSVAELLHHAVQWRHGQGGAEG